jgi:hypothetical protein
VTPLSTPTDARNADYALASDGRAESLLSCLPGGPEPDSDGLPRDARRPKLFDGGLDACVLVVDLGASDGDLQEQVTDSGIVHMSSLLDASREIDAEHFDGCKGDAK